jgi:hypothetical protein
MKAMELVNIGIESSTGAPLVVLREHDEPHRLLPVFVGGFEATSIALALGDSPPPRPLTHDLMVTLVERLDAEVDRVEIGGFAEDTFLAEVVLRGPMGEQHVDARPSDAIAIAVRVDAPVFVSEEVLERSGAAPEAELGEPEVIDPEVIEQEVEEFREFLRGVEPTDFASLALSAADEPDEPDEFEDPATPLDAVVDEAEQPAEMTDDGDQTNADSSERTGSEDEVPEGMSGEPDGRND